MKSLQLKEKALNESIYPALKKEATHSLSDHCLEKFSETLKN